MTKTLLTLAAVLAFSGSAFAASASQPTKHAPAVACVDTRTHVKLDCASTGSVEESTDSKADGKDPRLGISINPWIMPSSF